jgi:hypothetical protein
MTKASHDASGGRCHEGESRFLTCMSASRRGGAILQSPHRDGSFSSANQTADVPPASDVDQGRESVSDWIGEWALRAAVALWRPHVETSRWRGDYPIDRMTRSGRQEPHTKPGATSGIAAFRPLAAQGQRQKWVNCSIHKPLPERAASALASMTNPPMPPREHA